MSELRSKRQIIIDTINEGGATIESLAAAADCKYASVMSNFSMLRLMGMHPVKDVPSDENPEILTYRFVDSEEAAQIKEDQKSKTVKSAPAKSPADRLDAAEKRVARCEKAEKAASERAEKADDSEVLDLRADKALIELKLAKIELAEAEAACPVEADGTEEVVEDTDGDFDE